MKLSESILYNLSKRWKSPVENRIKGLGKEFGSDEFRMNYALNLQYDRLVKNGIGINIDIRDRSILEIGCGHGGIACFLAINGAKNVVGIDLNTKNLETAKNLAKLLQLKYGENYFLPVSFLEMDATDVKFERDSFDIIFADNVFEHFNNPKKVLEECYRVLKTEGYLAVPTFSSIFSKYGLHLKAGLKVPWANLAFSEKTICTVMRKLAEHMPELLDLYPGISNKPIRVKDLRKYGDLNNITYNKFKRLSIESGFEISSFSIHPSPFVFGKAVSKIPFLRSSILADIFSKGAQALLKKA